nr:hypothetical protein [Arthrobacter antioxidans]
MLPQIRIPTVSLCASRLSLSSTGATQLPTVLGLECAGLEFDDEVAHLLDVEEQQVDVEVIAADFEVLTRGFLDPRTPRPPRDTGHEPRR